MKYVYPTPYPSVQFERMVKYRLKMKGITQKQLAEMVNAETGRRISTAYMSRFMHGYLESMQTANGIAKVLGLGKIEHAIKGLRRRDIYKNQQDYETKAFLDWVSTLKGDEENIQYEN